MGIEQNTQAEMVAHPLAIHVVGAVVFDAHGFNWSSHRKVIDAGTGSACYVAGGDKAIIRGQRGGERRIHALWLPDAWDALVEITEYHSRYGAVRLKYRREVVQVGQVVVPR